MERVRHTMECSVLIGIFLPYFLPTKLRAHCRRRGRKVIRATEMISIGKQNLSDMTGLVIT